MPKDTVALIGSLDVSTANRSSATARRIRSAIAKASCGVVSGRMIANSSPPNRAGMSECRRCRWKTVAIPCRTASPARCPYALLMSRSRSRSAMISASGVSERRARSSSSLSALAKWRALKSPVFTSSRASCCSAGTLSERCTRMRGATAIGRRSGFQSQSPANATPRQGEDEVGREAFHREEAGAAERVPAREVQHRREHRVVQGDEDDRGHEAGERELEVRPQPGASHQLDCAPRREPVERVVGDVERLDVPGVANLQPLGDPVDDAEERDQLGRKKQDARDEEDDRRVVALVARCPHDEELRDRGTRREDEKRRPAVCPQGQMGEGQRRGGGRERADPVEERFGARR